MRFQRLLPARVRRYLPYACAFGWIEGIQIAKSLYPSAPRSGFAQLVSRKWRAPIHFRPGTADVAMFEAVFLGGYYVFDQKLQLSYIIDGGAHIGLSAVLFALKYPEAEIVAVEAEKTNYELLSVNVRAYPNIHPVYGGLWNTDTVLTIQDAQESTSSFQVTEDWCSSSVSLPGITIDGILDRFEFPRIDLLKLNVEGAERKIFESNCDDWLGLVRFMVIDLHDRIVPGCSEKVCAACSRHGLVPAGRKDNVAYFEKR